MERPVTVSPRPAIDLMRALSAALLLAACGPGPGPTAPSGAGSSSTARVGSGPAPASGQDTATAAPVAMRIGLNTTNAAVAPAWVAQEQGLFARHGIDAELVLIPGGAARVASSVLSGETPLVIISATAVVTAALGGADLVYVGSYANLLRFWMYARPEIASVPELRGRQVAISGRGGINQRAVELTLARIGLDPEHDVTLVSVGTMTDILTAMLTGAAAGGMVTPPGNFVADESGLRLLVDTTDYHVPTIMQGVVGSRGWLAQNEDLTRRVLQSIAEALTVIHQDKERTKEIIGKYTQVDDPLVLERTYSMMLPGWEPTLSLPAEALQPELDALAAEIPAARTARPEQFVENRFLDELGRPAPARQPNR
jgi:NitT/TauT family transport system substrate-binding protein